MKKIYKDELSRMRSYDDIIDLPHHVSHKRNPMPIADRAAQFAPFAALTGYNEAIDKTIEKNLAKMLADNPAWED